MTTTTEEPRWTVTVADRPTPMVLSVARRLRQSIAAGAVLEPTGEPRTVRLTSSTDAQRAHLAFAGTEVTVTADGADEADLSGTVVWTDPAPEVWEGEASGEFADGVLRLLSAPAPEWRDAVEAFFANTGGLPGMPSSLTIHCFDEDAQAEFGAPGGSHYLLAGTAGALSRLASGRSLITDELQRGELAIDGTADTFSALVGANLKVVCGEL